MYRLLKIKLIGFLKSADGSDISSVADPTHVNSSETKVLLKNSIPVGSFTCVNLTEPKGSLTPELNFILDGNKV